MMTKASRRLDFEALGIASTMSSLCSFTSRAISLFPHVFRKLYSWTPINLLHVSYLASLLHNNHNFTSQIFHEFQINLNSRYFLERRLSLEMTRCPLQR
jgi:hypothetical protein